MGNIFSFFSNALKGSATSATSKVGMWKFGLSAVCVVGGIVFAATGNVPVALALLGIAAQGTVSGIGSIKSADAPTTTNVATGDTSKVEVKP